MINRFTPVALAATLLATLPISGFAAQLDGTWKGQLTCSENLLNNRVGPNIDSANIAYNLLKTAAGGNIAIGPMLLGVVKPVHILTASATVRRIVNMTALTVAEANVQR